MARVNSTKRADEVVKIYEQFADFKTVKIHSKLSVAEKEAAKKALLTFEAQIIVCVDMLGEGFDLPELKIAAFHDIRKSLPVTLQFVFLI